MPGSVAIHGKAHLKLDANGECCRGLRKKYGEYSGPKKKSSGILNVLPPPEQVPPKPPPRPSPIHLALDLFTRAEACSEAEKSALAHPLKDKLDRSLAQIAGGETIPRDQVRAILAQNRIALADRASRT